MTDKIRETLHLFRRIDSRGLFFLGRETHSKEIVCVYIYIYIWKLLQISKR